MEFHRSALDKFADLMGRRIVEAGENHPDIKFSLNLMHSRYDGKKVVTFISPETGGMVLLGHSGPDHPMELMVTYSTVEIKNDNPCFRVSLPPLGIRQTMEFAEWIVKVFCQLSFLDTEEQFRGKLRELAAEAKQTEELAFIDKGVFTRFDHRKYDL